MRYQPNAQRVQAALDRANGVFATVLDTKMVGSEVAKVVVSLSNAKVTCSQAAASISRALQGHFVPVEASFRQIPNGNQPTFVGFVAAHREVIMADDERFKQLRAVTAGIMLDPADDSVWNLHTDDNGTFVLREGAEDIGRVLETARVRQTNAPALASVVSEVQAGDYVAFVDSASGNLRHGFVLAACAEDDTLEVITAEDENSVEIDSDQVVEAVELEPEDVEALEKASNVVKASFDDGKPSLTEYYKQLFAYAPEYLKEIQDIIKENAAF